MNKDHHVKPGSGDSKFLASYPRIERKSPDIFSKVGWLSSEQSSRVGYRSKHCQDWHGTTWVTKALTVVLSFLLRSWLLKGFSWWLSILIGRLYNDFSIGHVLPYIASDFHHMHTQLCIRIRWQILDPSYKVTRRQFLPYYACNQN